MERLAEGALLNDRYRIIEIIGQGGMGTVYRANDLRLDIEIAVKEMRCLIADDVESAESVRRFEQEARILAQLNHVNLPRVSDYFVDDNRRYLTMELVHGNTLDALLAATPNGRMALLDVLGWAVQLADVLSYLHSRPQPVVFRDLKPANVMVQSDGIIKLIDFGIARRYQEGASHDTALYGSPGYSPPEQYGNAQTDPRSDIFAMGATIHQLLTGRDPAATPFRFAPARSLNAEVPESLSLFLCRCVEMDVDRRCSSAMEARDALVMFRAELLAERSVSLATKPETTGNSGKAKRREPRIVSARLRAEKNRRLAKRLPLVLLALAVACFAAYLAIVSAKDHVVRRRPSAKSIAATPTRQATSPSTNHPTVSPADQPTNTTEQASDNMPFQIIQIYAKRSVTAIPTLRDGNGSDDLSFAVKYNYGGTAGKEALASVFFFKNDDGTPIMPSRTDSRFASPQGRLNVTQSFVAGNGRNGASEISLSIPTSEFPPDIAISDIRYQVYFYLDGQEAGHSDLLPITGN